VIILAIETSATPGSVAVADAQRILVATDLPQAQRTAQSLVPTIADVLRTAGLQPCDVNVVAVTQGPGSFTGLRLGVTTAKTLAYALGADLLGLNTLEVIAFQVPADSQPSGTRLHVVLDAQRQQLFAGCYVAGAARTWTASGETHVVDDALWLASLRTGDLATGPALKRLAGQMPDGVRLASAESWSPSAASLARVAWLHYQRGRRDDPFRLLPHYFRPSAAEETRQGGATSPDIAATSRST
jgi:tRNA threonylcarbamoyladenosine biosynthesis protein TsaB